MSGTVVDSSVWLDLLSDDPRWADWSEARIAEAASRGPLVVNAVILAEVAPQFARYDELRDALAPIVTAEPIPSAAAFLAGHAHTAYRRSGGRRAAILPDFLIGAHAAVTRRPLLTRDPQRIAAHIPGARLIAPS